MSPFVSETYRGTSFGLRAAVLANDVVLPYGMIEHELVDFTLVKLDHRWGPFVAADLMAAAWAVLRLRAAESMITRVKQIDYETGLVSGGVVLTAACTPLSRLEGLVLNAALRSAARALFGVAINVHTPETGFPGNMGQVAVLRTYPFVSPHKGLPWGQELMKFVAEQTSSATFRGEAEAGLQLA